MAPADLYVAALVKARGSSSVLSKLLTPKRIRTFGHCYRQITPIIGTAIGLVMVVLILLDSVSNNWAISDFCGNSAHFRTPVANIQTSKDLPTIYSFPRGYGIGNLSKIGFWMNNFSINSLVTNSPDVYMIALGAFTVTSSIETCADDSVTFLRGDAVSHAFTDDLVTNLPNASSTMPDILAMGYKDARVVVDLKLTTSFYLQDTTDRQNISVQFYRLYSKAYCTGCTPSMELGRGVCSLAMKYNATTRRLSVKSAVQPLGSLHDAGILFQKSPYMTLAIIGKYIAIFIAIAGYLASRKTVRWQNLDEEKTETVWHRWLNAIAPKYYPHMSHAIRFDLFCYNSDIFVILYVTSIIFDMANSLEYIRITHYYNSRSFRFDAALFLFAITTRLLWLNVFLLKLAKWLLSIVSPSLHCGQDKIMPWLNFSSVTMLYVSSVMLYCVPPYIEYCNSDRWDIHNNFQQLDGTFVNFFNSFYIRVLPSAVVGLVSNLAGVLVFDHLILHILWSAMKKNSLARQAIYNSSIVICEFLQDLHPHDGNIVLKCNARRLSTLQWYFMSHVVCFALPEKELVKKKCYTATNPTTKADETKEDPLSSTV